MITSASAPSGAHRQMHLLRWMLVAAGVLTIALIPPVKPVVHQPNPIVMENQQPGSGHLAVGTPGFGSATMRRGRSRVRIRDQRQQGRADRLPRQREPGAELHGRLLSDGLVRRPRRPPDGTGRAARRHAAAHLHARHAHRHDRLRLVAELQLTVPTTWTSGVYLVRADECAELPELHHVRRPRRHPHRRPALSAERDHLPGLQQLPRSARARACTSSTATAPPCRRPDTIRAAKVSFDRPYADGYGSGQLAGNSWNWERYYIGWLEQSGYDVTLLDESGHPHQRRPAARLQGFPVGRARRVLVEGDGERRHDGAGCRGEPRLLRLEHRLLAGAVRAVASRRAPTG